ncbi:hypothetical protein VK70_14935 [Paenibacillus durus ATCC 35681]|uniref:Transposase n=1 Tax=Paenibacillus durus ATCC 35681 TaxID=1333534 RepID=A0A0F7F9R6_PAEDU|nr:hypothetical protein VK70_00060 [Paenibacillus durus ATCC 35681]AKG34859.1 hypothetical protein VK70_10000 [Paenibacillus durus ATCC 35681]AKG35706.1 hypothetical protein VK70_14935 [Paenibacillus durus ATCC 35681]
MKRWLRPLEDAAHILNPKPGQTAASVRLQMQWLRDELENTYTREEDVIMVTNFRRYTEGFWEGLFACYDTSYLPRTNNDHERYFRQTKTRHRRMTGLRSWNRYIWRNGEFIVWVDDALDQADLLSRLRHVEYASYRQERSQWESRLLEGVQRLRFRRNPNLYLARLEQRVCLLNGQS